MSYGYLIGTMGTSPELKIDRATIINSLQENWSEIEVKSLPTNTVILNWETRIDDYLVLGSLQKNGQTIVIESSNIRAVAEFALWYRQLIPQEHKLFLYTGATAGNPIELTQDTSINGIAQALNNR